MNAVHLVQDETPPTEHRLLFFGAGSAAVGVAKQLLDFFIREHNVDEAIAKKRVWLVDSKVRRYQTKTSMLFLDMRTNCISCYIVPKGLVTNDRGDKLAKHKIYFSRDDNDGKQYKSLMDVIDYVKPTALIGLSSQGGIFNADVIRRMAELNKRPIIFPLSNPSVNAECTFEQVSLLLIILVIVQSDVHSLVNAHIFCN
jgi:malic enzyme